MAKRGIISNKSLKDKDFRPVRWRKYPHLFLIVCEDKKTEPYYFDKFIKEFPEETVFLRAVGTGMSSLGVVEQSLVEKNKLAEESNKSVDVVGLFLTKMMRKKVLEIRKDLGKHLKEHKNSIIKWHIVTRFLNYGYYYIYQMYL